MKGIKTMQVRKILIATFLGVPLLCSTCIGLFLLNGYYMNNCGFPDASVARRSLFSRIETDAGNADGLSSSVIIRGDERQQLAFSPDGNWLIVSGRTSDWISPFQDFRDGTCVSVWIVNLTALNVGRTNLRILHHGMETLIGPTFDLAIDPTSQFAVLGNREVVNLETGAVIAELDTRISRYIYGIAFSPDGQYLIAGDGIKGAIWNNDDLSLLHSISVSRMNTMLESPVAFIDQDTVIIPSDEERLRLWNVISGEEESSIAFETGQNFVIYAVNTAQQLIAYATPASPGLYVVQVETQRSWLVAQEPVSRLVFSPSGAFMVVAFADRIAIYDVTHSRMISTITRGTPVERITAMSFNPREDVVAVGHDSGTIEIISVEGERLASLRAETFGVTDLAFNPAGTLLAVSAAQNDAGRGGVWIWQVNE